MFAQLKQRKLQQQRQKQYQQSQSSHSQPSYPQRHPSPLPTHHYHHSYMNNSNYSNNSTTIRVTTTANRTSAHQDSNCMSRVSQYKRKRQEQNCSPMNGRLGTKQPLNHGCNQSMKPVLRTAQINRNHQVRSRSPNRVRNIELNQTLKPSRNDNMIDTGGYHCDESVVIVSKKPSVIEQQSQNIEVLKSRQKRSIINSYYLNQHPGLNYKSRAILMDWMMQLSSFYHLHRQTYYIAINIVDTYLSVISNMPLCYFQLVGVTSLLIASKLQQYQPQCIEQLSTATNNSFSQNDILKMQLLIMQSLKFKIRTLTYSFWINHFIQKWSEYDHKLTSQKVKNKQILFKMIYSIIDIAQLDIQSLQYKTRQIIGGTLLLIICLLSEDIELEEIQYSLTFSSKYLIESTHNTVVQYKKFLSYYFNMNAIQLIESLQFISSYFFIFQTLDFEEEFSIHLQNFKKNHLKLIEIRQQLVLQSSQLHYNC